jgi:hypothetical protein
VDQYFGVCLGVELMALRLQFPAQFRIVENFAIVDDPHRAIFVVDGLISPAEVDDTQSSMGQPRFLIHVDAKGIGTPVADASQHTA